MQQDNEMDKNDRNSLKRSLSPCWGVMHTSTSFGNPTYPLGRLLICLVASSTIIETIYRDREAEVRLSIQKHMQACIDTEGNTDTNSRSLSHTCTRCCVRLMFAMQSVINVQRHITVTKARTFTQASRSCWVVTRRSVRLKLFDLF